jgi:hypothetical protein
MKKKLVLLLLSDNDAGLPDLERLKRKYKKAIIVNAYKQTIPQKILMILSLYKYVGSLIIHTQSDKWGLLVKILIPAVHYQICHVQRNFLFSKKLIFLHKALYFFNRYFAYKNIFLSDYVAKSFGYRGKVINFEKFLALRTFIPNQSKFCFFFGRDEDYKNLEFFIDLARKIPEINFKIYSNNFRFRENLPENLTIYKKNFSDEEVSEIFKQSALLLLPYTSVAQSGPFYLGYEFGCPIIVPENDYFRKFRYTPGVFVVQRLALDDWIKEIRKIII